MVYITVAALVLGSEGGVSAIGRCDPRKPSERGRSRSTAWVFSGKVFVLVLAVKATAFLLGAGGRR